MADWLTAVIVAIVAGVPGVLAVALQVRKNRSEAGAADASAVESVTTAAQALLDPLRQRLRELEMQDAEKAARLDMFECYIEYLENGIHTLIGQLNQRGHRAAWKPMSIEAFRVQRVLECDPAQAERVDGRR